MNMEQVKWKHPQYANGTDAEKIYAELGEKTLSAEEIVAKARNENTELHKFFEWDDTKAGELYRLQQARHLLCNLVFVTETEEEEPIRVFHISTEHKKYKPTKLILQQPDEYAHLLAKAKQELYAFQRKYKALSELEEIFALIDEL